MLSQILRVLILKKSVMYLLTIITRTGVEYEIINASLFSGAKLIGSYHPLGSLVGNEAKEQ